MKDLKTPPTAPDTSLPNREVPAATALRRSHGSLKEQVAQRSAGLAEANRQLRQAIRKHQRTEAALRESENNFRALAENASDVILISLNDGRFVYGNRRAFEVTGYSPPELMNIGIDELVHPDEIAFIRQRYRKRVAGEALPNRYETRFVQKLGRVVPVEVSGSKTTWQGQPAVIAIIRDITERRQAEAALRESENNFRALAENANDGLVILNAGGRAHFANKQTSKITGYSESELSRIGFKKLAHPAELAKILQRYQARMAGEKISQRFETKIIHKQGHVVPIEASGAKTIWQGRPALLAIIRDITERKRLETELVEAHDELEQRVQERTQELMEAAEKMERQHRELSHHKKELEKVNRELVDTNKALSVLARNIDRKREETEKKISISISSRIIPLIEGLKNEKSLKNLTTDLDVLLASLNELTPGLKNGGGIIYALSSCELRVAAMIKNGLTSPKIARLLHVSPDTVKTHRRSIRRKLGIRNSRINLASFLRVKMG